MYCIKFIFIRLTINRSIYYTMYLTILYLLPWKNIETKMVCMYIVMVGVEMVECRSAHQPPSHYHVPFCCRANRLFTPLPHCDGYNWIFRLVFSSCGKLQGWGESRMLETTRKNKDIVVEWKKTSRKYAICAKIQYFLHLFVSHTYSPKLI